MPASRVVAAARRASTSRSCDLGQRALVLVREDLDELARATSAQSSSISRARGCRSSWWWSLDQAASAAPRRSAPRVPDARGRRVRSCSAAAAPARATTIDGVAAAGELAVLVVDVGDAAATCRRRSCGRSCRARRPCRRSCIRSRGRRCLRPPRSRPTVAHREALAGHAAEERLAGVAPYSTVLPTMMFSRRLAAEVDARAHDDAAARQALAGVVVGVADQVERDAAARGRRRSSGRRCLPAGCGCVSSGRPSWP